jgi:hypothetical protein
MPRAIGEGDNLSFLTSKHSMQMISGVLLLSTRPETGIGRFLALLIVIYNAADPRRQIAPDFPLAFTHVPIGSSRGRVRPRGRRVQDSPRTQSGDAQVPHAVCDGRHLGFLPGR